MRNSTKSIATDAEIRSAMDQILLLDIALTDAISKLDLIRFASENDDPIFSIFPHSNINWRRHNMLKAFAVKEGDWIKYHLKRCETLKEEYSKIINLDSINRFNLYFSKPNCSSLTSLIKYTFSDSNAPIITNLMDGIVEFDKYLKQRLLNAFLINSDLSLKLPSLDIAKSVLPLNSFYCLSLPVKNYIALGGSIRCTWGGDKYTRKISTFAVKNLLSSKS